MSCIIIPDLIPNDCSSDADGRQAPLNQSESRPSTTESEPSIYRVPECYRKLKPEAYSPMVVSFGPYHHDTSNHLRKMEEHKRRVLQHLVCSLKGAGSSITEKTLVEAVRRKLPQLMRCYTGFEIWRVEEGLEMSVVEEKYARILVARHIVTDELEASGETCACQVKYNAMKFARSLVKDVDVDEFTRIMVRGDDISRLMDRLDEKKLNSPDEFARSLVKDGLDTLAKLMVRDAVFMISLLVAASKGSLDGGSNEEATPEEVLTPMYDFVQCLHFPQNDPVFGKKAQDLIWPYFRRDILLVENQIPLQVLETLLGELSPQHVSKIKRLVMQLFNRDEAGFLSGQHILGLYRNARIINQSGEQTYKKERAKTFFLTGVAIEISSDSFNDFRYIENSWICRIINRTGTLYIPKVDLDDVKESNLLNLVAFENLHEGTGNEVTHYVVFMARLLRKPLDVKILDVWHKINLSNVWTKEAITEYFQQLARGVPRAMPKRPKEKGLMWPFPSNVLLWPAMISRFVLLHLMEDSGRLIAYVALAFTIVGWWVNFIIKLMR